MRGIKIQKSHMIGKTEKVDEFKNRFNAFNGYLRERKSLIQKW